MNQSGKSKQFKEFDDDECGGSGPRPPVPGEESCFSKMTSEDASTSSSVPLSQSPTHATAATHAVTLNSIAKWQEQLVYLLTDQQGVQLLRKFVDEEAGRNSIDFYRLEFYFACEGLKHLNDEKKLKTLMKVIHRWALIYILLKPFKQVFLIFFCFNQLFSNSKYVKPLSPTISHHLQNQLATINNTINHIKKIATPDTSIFDEIQKDVEGSINKSLYPRFLQSDLFIRYVEQIQKGQESENQNTGGSSSSISHSICSNSSISGLSTGGIINTSNISSNTNSLPVSTNLQTLHEDSELTLNNESSSRSLSERSMPKLTEKLLLATQKGRLEVRPQG